jgi:hypothetical protein
MTLTWLNKIEFLERLTELTEPLDPHIRGWMRDAALQLCGKAEFEGEQAGMGKEARNAGGSKRQAVSVPGL